MSTRMLQQELASNQSPRSNAHLLPICWCRAAQMIKGWKSSWQIKFAWRKRRSNSICCNLVAVPCLHIAAHEIQRTELQLVMNGRVRAAWRQFLLNALLISLGLILKYLVSSYWSWLLCWCIIHDRSSVPDVCIILYSLKALVLTL
jgi:hypothetical protein